MKKKNLLFLGKILLAFLFLVYLLQKGDLDISRVKFAFAFWPWILSAFFMLAIGIFLSIYRWQLLLRSQGISVAYVKALKLSFIGFFFNIFMPGSVGGDFIKAYYIAKQQEEKKTAAVTSVFLDRVIGLFSLVLLATLAVLSNFDFFWAKSEFRLLALFLFSISLFLGGTGVLFLFLGFSFPKKLKKKLDPDSKSFFIRTFSQVYLSLSLYKRQPRYIVYTVSLSLVAHCITVFSCYLLGQALGETHFELLSYYALIPLGMVIQAVPLSFGSWGVGEYVFFLIFQRAGAGNLNQGANVCFLWHLCTTCWNLIGIIFYLEEKAEVDRLITVEESA